MQVKLTESGLKVFGIGGDMAIVNVSNDRAYHLMTCGHANKDKPFMGMYEANHPNEAVVEEKPKPELKPKPKETATSNKAAGRSKAIKK